VLILAREYGETVNLLEHSKFNYFIYTDVSNCGKYQKICNLPFSIFNSYSFLRKHKPDLLVGAGLECVYTALLLNSKSVLFIDSMPVNESIYVKTQFLLYRPFMAAVITPASVVIPGSSKKSLGPKHIKINSYKELAYLHPNNFVPNDSIYKLMGLDKGEEFILLRFNSFDSVHDFGGVKGFSIDEKVTLVNTLSKHSKVFISSESVLPAHLEKFALNIPKHRIHDVLYYAKLVVADTGTMITESAVLGTPAVRLKTNVGDTDLGIFIELSNKYNLIYTYDDPNLVIAKANELIKRPNLKREWENKKEIMLNDKIDSALFMEHFIEKFPQSLNECLSKN
jgi:predicted glycosyltransferase